MRSGHGAEVEHRRRTLHAVQVGHRSAEQVVRVVPCCVDVSLEQVRTRQAVDIEEHEQVDTVIQSEGGGGVARRTDAHAVAAGRHMHGQN